MGLPWSADAAHPLLLLAVLPLLDATTCVDAQQMMVVPSTSIQIPRVANSFGQATDLQAFGDDVYVATKDGRIQKLRNVESDDTALTPDTAVFLDILNFRPSQQQQRTRLTRIRLSFQFCYEWLVLCLLRCLLYTSPSPRDLSTSRMPSSA